MGSSDGEGHHDRLLWSAARKARAAGEHVFPSLVRALRQAADMDERQAARAAFEFVRQNTDADAQLSRSMTHGPKTAAWVWLGAAALSTLYAWQSGGVWARALVAPYLWSSASRALIDAYWAKRDPRKRWIGWAITVCLYVALAVWLLMSPEVTLRRAGLVWLALAAINPTLAIRYRRSWLPEACRRQSPHRSRTEA